MWDEIFDPRPDQWGSEGDQQLWDALRDRVKDHRVPASSGLARQQLDQLFEQLVGVRANPYLVVQRADVEFHARGDGSGGPVDLRAWHDRLLPLLAARAAERLGEARRPAAGERPVRTAEEVEELFRCFEFGDGVLRHVELHLPAAGPAHAQLRLEVQEGHGDDWGWTSIVLAMDGLTAFRLTRGPRDHHEVLTGPPIIVEASDGTWVVDLARDRDVHEAATGPWYDSPQFVQGSALSWYHWHADG